MRKTIAFTFLLGAVTGSVLTFYFSIKAPDIISEEKVVSQETSRESERETLNGEMLDIPGEVTPSEAINNDASETVDYEHPEDEIETPPSQMDKFERAISSEEDPGSNEELPTSVPEEAPPEIVPEEINEEDHK